MNEPSRAVFSLEEWLAEVDRLKKLNADIVGGEEAGREQERSPRSHLNGRPRRLPFWRAALSQLEEYIALSAHPWAGWATLLPCPLSADILEHLPPASDPMFASIGPDYAPF